MIIFDTYYLFKTLADIEYRLNIGASEKIQLAVIVAAFSKIRNNVPRMEEWRFQLRNFLFSSHF